MADLKKLGLADSGFLADVPDLPARLIMSIEGMEGTGKTETALDAPCNPALVYLGADRNSDGVVQKKAKEAIKRGGCIIPQYFAFDPHEDWEPAEIAENARPVRNQWIKAYRKALRSEARTIVIDTGGWVLWLLRMARFGTVKIFPPVLSAETNQQFMRLMNEGRDSGKTIIWIHRLRDERKDKTVVTTVKGKKVESIVSVFTGEQERVGHKDVGYEMQAILRMDSKAPLGFGLPLVGTLQKCTVNAEMVGEEFTSDAKASFQKLKFANIAARIFENHEQGSDPSEWK